VDQRGMPAELLPEPGWRHVVVPALPPPTARATAPGREDRTGAASAASHDTLGIVVQDDDGFSCGVTTNGANHKVAGRVGDAPIVGSGCYATNTSGAAATGDGDVMMRFLPALRATLLMDAGVAPSTACAAAMAPIASAFPTFSGALVCLNERGDHAGVEHNMGFSYTLATSPKVEVIAGTPV